MNLLTDPLISISADPGKHSLPSLFAAMAGGEVGSFPGLRPHQRPAWHMFLVQLAALAAWKARLSALPESPDTWADALRHLTPGHSMDEPWRLVVTNGRKPAFLQPPDPGGLKWEAVKTPDELDLLIASKNHDLKRSTLRRPGPEDWLYALVSLQTSEGFGGAKNYGIARMNGAYGSRPMLSLAPTWPDRPSNLSVPSAAWWRRDIARLLDRRRSKNHSPPVGLIGGPGVLWALDWTEGAQLDLDGLDPWFVEICRRIRLRQKNGVVGAVRANSRLPRCNAKAFNGNTGDPWAPVGRSGDKEGKCLSIAASGFHYRKLCELLFSGDWTVPYLEYKTTDGTQDMLLVAEVLARGQGKTQGFKSRVVHIPGPARGFIATKRCGDLAKAQMEEIQVFDKALRSALALAAATGERSAVDKKHYEHAAFASARFDREADRIFFDSLWRRLCASPADDQGKSTFLAGLHDTAQRELDAALPAVPCSAIHRPKAEARARRRFRSSLRRNPVTRELFLTGDDDDD